MLIFITTSHQSGMFYSVSFDYLRILCANGSRVWHIVNSETENCTYVWWAQQNRQVLPGWDKSPYVYIFLWYFEFFHKIISPYLQRLSNPKEKIIPALCTHAVQYVHRNTTLNWKTNTLYFTIQHNIYIHNIAISLASQLNTCMASLRTLVSFWWNDIV